MQLPFAQTAAAGPTLADWLTAWGSVITGVGAVIAVGSDSVGLRGGIVGAATANGRKTASVMKASLPRSGNAPRATGMTLTAGSEKNVLMRHRYDAKTGSRKARAGCSRRLRG